MPWKWRKRFPFISTHKRRSSLQWWAVTAPQRRVISASLLLFLWHVCKIFVMKKFCERQQVGTAYFIRGIISGLGAKVYTTFHFCYEEMPVNNFWRICIDWSLKLVWKWWSSTYPNLQSNMIAGRVQRDGRRYVSVRAKLATGNDCRYTWAFLLFSIVD